MKKIISFCLVILIFAVSANSAELVKIFRLKDAEYSEVSKDILNKYKINDNFLLAMKMSLDPENNNYYGDFVSALVKDIELKNWTYSEIFIKKDGNSKTYIEFKDEKGFTFIIKSNYSDLVVGDQEYRLDNGTHQITVVCISGKFQVLVNNEPIYKGNHRFANLKEITRKYGNDKRQFLVDMSLNKLLPSKKQ